MKHFTDSIVQIVGLFTIVKWIFKLLMFLNKAVEAYKREREREEKKQ